MANYMDTDRRPFAMGAAVDTDLLERAMNCWEGLREFRQERERCKRFTYGDQWGDWIEDRGVRMREEDYIVSQGNMPLKNNLIRRLVRNVLGVYRDKWRQPRVACADVGEQERLQRMLDENMELNRMEELYARTMEEFLISGLAVHKKWYGRRNRRSACRTDIVSPSKFFFDTSSRDFRGGDMTIMGEVHDLEFDEMAATLCRNRRELEELARIYGVSCVQADRTVCRLYEVWRRIRVPFHWEEQWCFSFLAPTGHVIRTGVSPYLHGLHPYVMKAYPFVDGEIHSFVGDVLDQQKLTNRLISMYDWILRASAKGVLLFPEGSLPEGADINDIADEWGRFNGVIVYRPRTGVPVPQQVSSKATDIGITELLEIQMNMMEDISGVNGALQGKLDSTSMSGTLYDQQTRNSLTALADLMKSFEDFTAEATRIDISNLKQFALRT